MIETLERQVVADPQRACRYVMIVHQRAWGLVLTYWNAMRGYNRGESPGAHLVTALLATAPLLATATSGGHGMLVP
jgi:hypothetical protein